MPVEVRLVGELDVAALQRVLNEIVRRHEVLRTTFAAADGRPRQVIAPTLRSICRSSTYPSSMNRHAGPRRSG